MEAALDYVSKEFPHIRLEKGTKFSWNASAKTITYPASADSESTFVHGLFHEVAHSILKHEGFRHDIDLLKKERDAWSEAKKLLERFDHVLDSEHVEDCLDTYRDWIYLRAACPQCELVGTQSDAVHYSCPYCLISWNVPGSRLCEVTQRVIA
jgi:hypothetical protein